MLVFGGVYGVPQARITIQDHISPSPSLSIAVELTATEQAYLPIIQEIPTINPSLDKKIGSWMELVHPKVQNQLPFLKKKKKLKKFPKHLSTYLRNGKSFSAIICGHETREHLGPQHQSCPVAAHGFGHGMDWKHP